MDDAQVREQRVQSLRELAAEITKLAGHLNAAHFRWLSLIAEFDRRHGWSDGATQSCAHWLNCYVPFRTTSGGIRGTMAGIGDSTEYRVGTPDIARHSLGVYRPFRKARSRSPGLKRPGFPCGGFAFDRAFSFMARVASR
jgi:hypothetical protein